jgi:hypothetical protein
MIASRELHRWSSFDQGKPRTGEGAMEFREGDRVLVNLAPFIGSSRRSQVQVPCRVLAVNGTHVEVGTEYPFRELSLRVLGGWIEGKLAPSEKRAQWRAERAAGTGKRALAALG